MYSAALLPLLGARWARAQVLETVGAIHYNTATIGIYYPGQDPIDDAVITTFPLTNLFGTISIERVDAVKDLLAYQESVKPLHDDAWGLYSQVRYVSADDIQVHIVPYFLCLNKSR